jgi:hypothetical protein
VLEAIPKLGVELPTTIDPLPTKLALLPRLSPRLLLLNATAFVELFTMPSDPTVSVALVEAEKVSAAVPEYTKIPPIDVLPVS